MCCYHCLSGLGERCCLLRSLGPGRQALVVLKTVQSTLGRRSVQSIHTIFASRVKSTFLYQPGVNIFLLLKSSPPFRKMICPPPPRNTPKLLLIYPFCLFILLLHFILLFTINFFHALPLSFFFFFHMSSPSVCPI